jgi:putative toxin-antitoxin system antitoxin component, TIGR02293 family
MAITDVIRVLGGERVIGGPVRSLAELDARVREGLPRHTLEVLAAQMEPDAGRCRRLVWTIVPRATWTRRKNRLTPGESEVVERLGRLWSQALAVWENEPDARAFFRTPHALLGGRSPFEAAQTELGGRQVERILLALEHGLPV